MWPGRGGSNLADTTLTSVPQEAGSKAHCVTSKESNGMRMLVSKQRKPLPFPTLWPLLSYLKFLKRWMSSTPKQGLLIKMMPFIEQTLRLETFRGERWPQLDLDFFLPWGYEERHLLRKLAVFFLYRKALFWNYLAFSIQHALSSWER